MSGADLQNNWALVAGLLLVALVFVYVSMRVYQRSANGQLRRTRRSLKRAVREKEQAISISARCQERLQKLMKKSDSTKPRILQEAREALDDATALEKIAGDKVLVAENHVRKVIVSEYPPAQHERLRKRFLSSESVDAGPFTF